MSIEDRKKILSRVLKVVSARDSLKLKGDDPLRAHQDQEVWNAAIDKLSDKDAEHLALLNKSIKRAVAKYEKTRSSTHLRALNSLGRDIEDFETSVGLRDKNGYVISSKNSELYPKSTK